MKDAKYWENLCGVYKLECENWRSSINLPMILERNEEIKKLRERIAQLEKQLREKNINLEDGL